MDVRLPAQLRRPLQVPVPVCFVSQIGQAAPVDPLGPARPLQLVNDAIPGLSHDGKLKGLFSRSAMAMRRKPVGRSTRSAVLSLRALMASTGCS